MTRRTRPPKKSGKPGPLSDAALLKQAARNAADHTKRLAAIRQAEANRT